MYLTFCCCFIFFAQKQLKQLKHNINQTVDGIEMSVVIRL